MEISIIIPVYNTERYIIRCLDSIFSQRFSGTFEVIAVDDASTDHSLQLMSDYQKNENRLRIIALDRNSKQPIARSTGMNASIGDYIMHVDADDWILPDTLEKLYAKCIDTDADIVVFNYVRENSKGEQTWIRKIKKELVTTDKLKVQQYFLGMSWSKIVKRNLTSDMISGKVGVNTTEDLLYSTEILLRAEKICLVPESYYVYFVNIESIMHTIKPEQYLQNQIIILNQLQKIILKYNANSKLIRNMLNYVEKWIYLEFLKYHLSKDDEKDILIKLVKEFAQYPILSESRIRSLELSIRSRMICLFEIIYRFGLRTTMGFIRLRFKN